MLLDASGVKAMPGSIPEPNRGSFNNWKKKENTDSQMGHTKKCQKICWITKICLYCAMDKLVVKYVKIQILQKKIAW